MPMIAAPRSAAPTDAAAAEPGPPLPSVPGVEHRFIDANGIRIHVAEAGAGPPLMLIHGGPQHWYAWRHVIPELSREHRLICPDLRGFGWTEAPRTGYSVAERARDMLAILDALELDTIDLAGHDWGGMIGFRMCFDAPTRVKRFMAISINHPWQRWYPGLTNDWRLWYQVLIALPGLGPWIQRKRPGLIRLMLGLGVGDTSIWAPGEREHYAARMQDTARALGEAKMYRALWTRAGLQDMMSRTQLTMPILLVHGTRDFAVSVRIQRTGWQNHAPSMSLEFVEDGSHWLLNERPQLIVDRAKAFFAVARAPTEVV
jgi:pimeloyl-ACP methyl ester carboxylesterase